MTTKVLPATSGAADRPGRGRTAGAAGEPGRTAAGVRGFTLMELLIVIAILGVLAVAFLPRIIGGQEAAKISETKARMVTVQSMAEAYARKASRGYYPPADFTDPEGKAKPRADANNAGIESFVYFTHQKSEGYETLEGRLDWLVNTDGDDNGAPIPLLQTSKKMEVADGWGNPIAYFNSESGYDKPQTYVDVTGGTQTVRAARLPGGGHLAPRKFQLLSAGPDGKFGTEDDITVPELPR